MKKNYNSPIVKLTYHTAFDIITTSQDAYEKDPFEIEGMFVD